MSSVPRTTITLAEAAPDLGAAQPCFQKVAYPGSVDLVTRELLRILSGRLSCCTLCRNLRLNAAIDRGFDESMVAISTTCLIAICRRASKSCFV